MAWELPHRLGLDIGSLSETCCEWLTHQMTMEKSVRACFNHSADTLHQQAEGRERPTPFPGKLLPAICPGMLLSCGSLYRNPAFPICTQKCRV